MNTRPRLAEVLKLLKTSKGIRVRAGTAQHRFIGIWFVLVADRIFARSWSVKPNGWYHTFLKESRGTIQVGKIEIAVRPVRIRSKRLKDEVDRAYLNKYSSRGEVKYANDLSTEKSRATTLEFVPLEGDEPSFPNRQKAALFPAAQEKSSHLDLTVRS